jgi:hypothetical protein
MRTASIILATVVGVVSFSAFAESRDDNVAKPSAMDSSIKVAEATSTASTSWKNDSASDHAKKETDKGTDHEFSDNVQGLVRTDRRFRVFD